MAGLERVTYGAALRAASRADLSDYDKATISAFLADAFLKEISEVERDLHVVRSIKVA